MDTRVFRMAILTIISAFILVLVIVYATNTDKINSLFGADKKSGSAAEQATEETTEEVIIYGDQIGDNLDAFLLDDDFFDETEKIPSVVVIKKSDASDDESSADSSFAEEGDEQNGTGMAVVGQLTNPNLEGASTTDSSGYLTSLPDAPAGGYGEYIPSDQTITGTPVGQP